jgi:hypothetical protein
MRFVLSTLLLVVLSTNVYSNELTIKETNFVNRAHQEAVEFFNGMRSDIEKNKQEIEAAGGLSGKQIFCKGINNERYGYYFVFESQMMKYRFVPDPERNPFIELGSRNVIHPALEIGMGEYSASVKEVNLGMEKVNRETLDFYQVLNPLTGYNYKKVGSCKLVSEDMYPYFKKFSDNFADTQNKQKEKNKL